MAYVNWPFSWRKRGRRAVARAPAPAARPICAMLALADGSAPGGTPGGEACGVLACRGFGRCPVMTELHELAAHLRRVRAQVQHERSQPSMTGRHVRITAARLAYSDLLVEACEKLRIETDLSGCSGVARDLEIVRVEAALATYGITP
jgi:hypothetical protein